MSGDAVGAGQGSSGVVDHEVVSTELVIAELRVPGERPGLDQDPMLGFGQLGKRFAGAVGGVGQHIQPGLLGGEQGDAGGTVTFVRWGEIAGSDQPGVGFDCDVGFVAVAIGRPRFVHVACLGIDGGDHPVLRDVALDAPRSFFVADFDVLAGNQREQTNQLLLSVVELDAVDGIEDRECVVDETADQCVAGDWVVPCTRRLPRRLVIVITDQHGRCSLRDRVAGATNHRHQLRHRVLCCDRVIQQRRIECSTMLVGQHIRGGDDVTDRVEDPLRTLGLAQTVAPLRQRRGMEPGIGDRQSARHLPPQIRRQRSVANAWTASRSDSPSSDCNTSTDAITSAG